MCFKRITFAKFDFQISFGLSGCSKLTNEDMKVIADSFPKLERIDLSGVSVNCFSRYI